MKHSLKTPLYLLKNVKTIFCIKGKIDYNCLEIHIDKTMNFIPYKKRKHI